MTNEEIKSMPIKEFNQWIIKLAKEHRFEDMKKVCLMRDSEASDRDKRIYD